MIKTLFGKTKQLCVLSLFCLSLMTGKVDAERGYIYSCAIQRDYRHPVSGQVEDSGGEKSFEIGQGMVEGSVYGSGMLEQGSSGRLNLTFRMSLADFSGNYQFWIQPGGTGAFQAVDYSITNTGSDTNGTTKDVSIVIPDVNTVIRGSMYVEPMGRAVIFYLSPASIQEGYAGDMIPTLVTEKEAGEPASDAVTAVNQQRASERQKSATPGLSPEKENKSSSASRLSQSPTTSLTSQKSNRKKGGKMGLMTSLDQKQPSEKLPASKGSIVIYYLPTVTILLGALFLYIKKKRKSHDKTN